jgi:alpha-galactosidase
MNSTIHMNYKWEDLRSGEFILSSDGKRLFEGYAEASDTYGRTIDTRTDRYEHAETCDENGNNITRIYFISRNGLRLTAELGIDENGIPYAGCVLSDTGDVPVSTSRLLPVVMHYAEDDIMPMWKSLASKMLLVPYDNTMWSRYETAPLRPGRRSSDLSMLLSGYDKSALLFGAVDFDTWKNAAVCSAYDARKIELRCGEADEGTHDTVCHGAVTGMEVRSSRFIFLYGDDHRDLLESYGDVVNRLTGPSEWKYGIPFGWNSWSAHQSYIDAEKADTASGFIKEKFQDTGAVAAGAQVCINLDAGWRKMTEDELSGFVSGCHSRGQKAGTYDAPFAFFGKDVNERLPYTAGDHTYAEILMKDCRGNLLPRVDGAYPMDVTNPLWKEMTAGKAEKLIKDGYDYVKLDFMSHAGMEGEHYDKAVSTGRQAINMGYAFIRDILSEEKAGRPIFISLSIAPLFPNGYGHARRFSCDAFGCAEDIEYVLNAQTYAWWENERLYEYNDPDHICLRKSFCADRDSSSGEARARYTSAVITGGIMIMSEDFTNAEAARRAEELASNAEINRIAASHRAFRPAGTAGSGACSIFTAVIDGNDYAAVFNTGSNAQHIEISPEEYGLPVRDSYTEIWTGRKLIKDSMTGKIGIDFSGCDACILR